MSAKKPTVKAVKKAAPKKSLVKKPKTSRVPVKKPAVKARKKSVKLFGVPFTGYKDAKATSFADPADVRAFRRCKQQLHSDNFCFSKGDNGEGVWGDNTAQEKTAMVALPPEDMAAKFNNNWRKAKHAKVVVEVNGRAVNAIVADRMPWRRGRKFEHMIDLNPGALKALGLKAPLMIDARWKWA